MDERNSTYGISDLEASKLEHIASDGVAMSALRKVFLTGIYRNGVIVGEHKHNPGQNFMINKAIIALRGEVDEAAVGRQAMIDVKAIQLLEGSFIELENEFKTDGKNASDETCNVAE